NSIGNAPDDIKTDRPPYVVNHQMKISYACRVDGFQIPRGEPAPAVVEIGRPIGKTQSRQIKGYSLKPTAGQFRQKLSIKKARSRNPMNTNNGLLPGPSATRPCSPLRPREYGPAASILRLTD